MLPASLVLLVCLGAYLPITNADRLAAPVISFSAGYSTYLIGESVSLKCLTSVVAKGYSFYRNGKLLNGPQDTSLDTYRIPSVNSASHGSYTCSYWVQLSKGPVSSEESQHVLLHVVEHPATPRLILEPQNTVYIRGESVRVRCDVQMTARSTEYHFFKDGAEIATNGGTAGSTFMIDTISSQSAGSYSCLYQVKEPGRILTSMRSSQMFLYVTDQPPAPAISYGPPHPVFITGETVTMQCETPSPSTVSGYRFYHAGREVAQRPGTAPGIFEMGSVRVDQEGLYSCIYWAQKVGRVIPSLESIPAQVYVTEPLLPPILTLVPYDGRVSDGDTITLHCLLPTQHVNLTASFIVGPGEVLHSASSNVTEASFSFQVNQARDSGERNYSCFFEADVRGRRLRSPTSRGLQVVLQDASSAQQSTTEQTPPPKDDTDLAYVSLTWSTLASAHSSDRSSTNEIFC
ncbi:Fc receptor-like protein 5 isoform X2 [Ambystoma mexicanum]|uniref:Fc receptor-like protein 5 isoform X2 n=1 Tax=Ambystoma mexicanum TaxID=8296 RepID=UPI0037E7BB60